MKDTPEEPVEKRFEEAWRRRLERPLRTPPPQAAARIAAQLESRRRSRITRWIPLAAAAAVALAVGVTLLREPAPQLSLPARPTPEVRPLGEGEILLWLDENTPLYMTFQPPAVAPSSEEKS